MIVPFRGEPAGEVVIGLSAAPWVKSEAEEVAENEGKPGIASCDRRFECFLENLEEALTEYTTMQFVQQTLQRITNGYVFLSWNGATLMEP